MQLQRGIKLLDEKIGSGAEARKGDRVVFTLRIFLHHGDEVPLDERQMEQVLSTHNVRTEEGRQIIDRVVTLGKREVVAAVEYSLIGMKAGGYRKVKAGPHLAYRDQGIPGLIPPSALLILEMWLREIQAQS